MKLRLYVPFTTAGLRLDPMRVTQDVVSYVDWWTDIAASAKNDLSGVPGIGVDVVRCDFLHAKPLFNPAAVLFSELDSSTDLSLIQFEVLIRVPISSLMPLSANGDDALVELLTSRTVLVVARSFADNVGHVDCEIDLSDALAVLPSDVNAGSHALEQVSQQIGQKLALMITNDVFAPFAAFLTKNSPDGWLLVDGVDRPVPPKLSTGVARWVSRAILMEEGDSSAVLDLGCAWLADVYAHPETLREDIEDDAFCEATWVNWFARPGAYDAAATLQHQFETAKSDEPRPVRFLSPRFEALLYGQAFYAAFDSLQTGAAQILTKSFSTSRGAGLRHDRELLDENIRDLSVLLLHYDDALRHFARSVRLQFDEIIESWDFERTSRAVAVERIRACEKRLDVIGEEVAEKNSRFTDLLLQAIGFTTIIDLMLNIASYGRSTRGDIGLATYERDSWFNIAAWLGAASTDTILISGVLLALGFVFVYSVLRSDR